MYEINIRSAWPDSIMIPAGIRPLWRYQESSQDVGLGPHDPGSVHAGLGVDARDAVGEQERRLGHPDLSQITVLLLEHRTVDLGDPDTGVDLELSPVEAGPEGMLPGQSRMPDADSVARLRCAESAARVTLQLCEQLREQGAVRAAASGNRCRSRPAACCGGIGEEPSG